VQAANVFEQLGFSPEQSAREVIKADLYVAILKLVRERGLSPGDVGAILGKPHSRVSELLNGKLNLMSIDTLVEYLDKLGAVVKVSVRKAS
jgi:predicted XRE-type DNA-binding protein